MDEQPVRAPRRARSLTGRGAWQFPVFMVLGGSLLAACTSKNKPTEPDPATALQLVTAPPGTFASRATITPAPVIQLVDANGVAVSSAGVNIQATLSGGSGSLQGRQCGHLVGPGHLQQPQHRRSVGLRRSPLRPA
jgi:hypothetical protein